jgi:site-specific DNA-methyltransferase (adenine-specific)
MIDVKDILNTVINDDCKNIMKQLPDKCIDLVLTDPPYGIDVNFNCGRRKGEPIKHESKEWDKNIPDEIYFKEIFRISKNQIIWGGNYFSLPKRQGWIFWDKQVPVKVSFSDGELAWTSFNVALKKIIVPYSGFNGKEPLGKLHPTQKPEKLFKQVLLNYSTPGMTIFDPFAGSGTTAIACLETGRNYILVEKETDYIEIINKRISQWKEQGRMFE